MTDTPPPFNLEELRDQVEQLDGDTWRVDRTLKSTPFGETQVVYRAGSQAGPFIRKLLANDSGQGAIYETIFRAQAAGKRFVHIPFIYDCTRTESGIAVVMEYVRGKTLREYVKNVGPGERALQFAAPALCDALDELHTALETPIVHRDIKPGNLMVSPAGITFIDLDITRSWRDGSERDTTRFGTPGYAPPEQFGFDQTTVASDIFAAGMTLAFCCTGEDPTAQLRESGFDDERVPPWIRPVLVRATQFDPRLRYQSAAEMRDAIHAALSSFSANALPSTPARPASAPPSPSRETAQPNRETSDARTHPRTAPIAQPADSGSGKTILKYLWNALAIILFAYFAIVVTTAFATTLGNPDTGLAALAQSHPVTAIIAVIEVIGVYVVMALCLYLALFKMHLRRIAPFSRFTWKQELPVGIGIIALYALAVALIGSLPLP